MKRLNQKTVTIPCPSSLAAPKPEHVKVILTAKEQETLEWIFRGKSAWEVSRILDKTESAVNFHLGNIRRKFGVNSMRSAVIMAIEQGLIVLH